MLQANSNKNIAITTATMSIILMTTTTYLTALPRAGRTYTHCQQLSNIDSNRVSYCMEYDNSNVALYATATFYA